MTIPFTGELIAFGTVLSWSGGAQFFESAGKRIGSLSVNMIRLIVAFLLFCLTLMLMGGDPIPFDFPGHAWKWLLLSGLVGFTFGDMCLLQAFVEIGPRITMLIVSVQAPITALIGWWLLEEHYRPLQWIGILVTMIGVGWVIYWQNSGRLRPGSRMFERRITRRGVAIAFGAALGQAVGYVMSKMGMMVEGGFLDPFASAQIRVIGGTAGFTVFFFLMGWWPKVIQSMRNLPGVAYSAAGGVLGPYLGVALSLAALHYTSTGVASTILSLVPIVLIPFVIVIHREHVSIHGVLGAVIALVGVGLLVN